MTLDEATKRFRDVLELADDRRRNGEFFADDMQCYFDLMDNQDYGIYDIMWEFLNKGDIDND
jgi:hypothetical protein